MSLNKYYPALVSSFGAAALTTIPGLKSFACCLLVPAACIAALYLDKKINGIEGEITKKHALATGLLTGLLIAFFATFFDLLLTYIFKANDLTVALPELEMMIAQFEIGKVGTLMLEQLRSMSEDITRQGFSIQFTVYTLFSNLISNAIFGLLGGLLGMVILNKQFNKAD